jgi:hypothetical protein
VGEFSTVDVKRRLVRFNEIMKYTGVFPRRWVTLGIEIFQAG